MACKMISELAYGCCDLILYNRTADWIKSSGISGMTDRCKGYACPEPIVGVDDYPVGGWTTPIADEAEWYCATDSRSEHFLGMSVWEDPIWSTSLSDSRDIELRVDDGILGVPKLKPVEVVFSFMLWVDDCCAIDFAKSWLVNQLRCASDATPFDGCKKPTLSWYECQGDGCEATDASYRSLANVGVKNVAFQEILGFNGCCLGIEVEVTFASESPYFHNFCETTILDEESIVPFEECVDCADLKLTPEPICRFVDCQCGSGDKSCNSCNTLAPVNIGSVSSCYCPPVYFWRKCFNVAASSCNSEQLLGFTIYGGRNGLKNIRLTGHTNPNDSDVTLDYWRCIDPCVDIGISEIKPFETFVIDSARGTIYGNCGGGAFTDASDRVFDIGGTGSKFFTMDCSPIRLCIEAGQVNYCSLDATMTVVSSTRELR